MGSEIYIIREKLGKKRVSMEEIKRIAMNNEELLEAAGKGNRSKACYLG